MKPIAHTHSQSLGREPGRAEVAVVYERIERIGFSVRLLAVRAARVPHLRANCNDKNGDTAAFPQDAFVSSMMSLRFFSAAARNNF